MLLKSLFTVPAVLGVMSAVDAAHLPPFYRHHHRHPTGWGGRGPSPSPSVTEAEASFTEIASVDIAKTTVVEIVQATVTEIASVEAVKSVTTSVSSVESVASSVASSVATSVVEVESTSSTSSSTSSNTTSNGNIIIPFYLYPSAGAWTPLENLIASNPSVQFTVIINPDNGPGGSTTTTDSNFLSAVPKLTAYTNALVLGYVSTQQGSRDISDVEADIKTYANWPSTTGESGFKVQGVFLDEAPAEYEADTVTYYQQAAQTVRGSEGLSPNYVVMNPGAVPDESYLSIPDSTVIFESAYSEFLDAVSANEFESIKGTNLTRLASMVYDVPASVDLSTLVGQLKDISGQTYLSNLDSYMEYDEIWSEVVSLLSS